MDVSARNCFCILKLLTLCLALLIPAVAAANENLADWSGNWETRWRDGGARLQLQQNGRDVTGVYPLLGGEIEGRATERTLRGRWREGERSGNFLFVQSRDGGSFAGRFESGEWWTGFRATDETSTRIPLNQSSPMATMRTFLTATNQAGPGNIELLGTAAALIRPKDGLTDGVGRLDHTRKLFEVIDQLTFRLWDLPRALDEDDFTVELMQAGTSQTVEIAFQRQNGRWFLTPPSGPELEDIRDRLRIARGREIGAGVVEDTRALRTPRAAMMNFLIGFHERDDGGVARITETLDLRGMSQERDPMLYASYLRLVLDRIGLVIPQEIPDDPDSRSPYVHFEHPRGDIVIAPVETEDGVIWQFEPETLRSIRAVYTALEDMPVAPGLERLDALNVHFVIRQNIRQFAPDFLLPLGPLERWQWVGVGAGLMLAALAGFAGSGLLLGLGARFRLIDREVAPTMHLLCRWALRFLFAGVVIVAVTKLLGLPDIFATALKSIGWSFVIISGVVLGWQLIGWLAWRNAQAERIAGHNLILVSLASGLARIFLVIGGGLLLANLLALPVAGVIAGFGIGGLAVALAAQPTLMNILAGFTLYADRPVSVGDFCRFGDTMGTVEAIGLRSTRLRTLDRTVISVPNSQFLDMQIENFARRDQMRFATTLQLRYETTPDQLRYVLTELRKLLIAHPMVFSDPIRVRFMGFGEHSLDIEIFAYITASDMDTFTAAREDILLRMMAMVEEAGAQFAFPSMVHYNADDTPPDTQRKAKAEATVNEWRACEDLPFPDFEWQTKAELSNTLTWPPEGSVQRPKRRDTG